MFLQQNIILSQEAKTREVFGSSHYPSSYTLTIAGKGLSQGWWWRGRGVVGGGGWRKDDV